jgi:predicted homoserine dehydrogenase-like protein
MKIRVAVVGTGAMGRGVVSVIKKHRDMEVSAIADINPKALESTRPFLTEGTLITTEPVEVLDTNPDILVDATPTIVEAAILSRQALRRKINVVLMNGEVDQVYGRLLAKEAKANGVIITSDAGDQHGVLARQIDEINSMGLEIVMAANNKGFLYEYATPESIVEEAAKRKLTVHQCTAYTDGTKLAIEMAIIANAKNLGLLQTGMVGPKAGTVQDSFKLFDFDQARELGGVVDYVLGARPGGSVFTIGYSDDPDDRFYMNYYKMGEGPYYLFLRPYHLCHFETPWAIQRIMYHKKSVLVQKKRVLEVGTRAKRDLEKGSVLDGIGGFNTYGILEKPDSLPIGLSENVVLTKRKKKDAPIGWDDVEFVTDDPRLKLWEEQQD